MSGDTASANAESPSTPDDPDESRSGVRVVHRPARESVALALAPGVVATLGLAIDLVAFAVGLAGLAVTAVATSRGSRVGVTAGTGLLFGATLYVGIAATAPAVVMLVTAGVVVTWTTAQHVVGLGDHLGRDAPVRRSVLVHLGGATVTTLSAGGLALVVYFFAAATLPPSALVFLVVGAAVLIYALEP